METKKINRIVNEVRQDTELGVGEKLIICLNRVYDSMLEDAWLLTAEGAVRDAFWETSSDALQADEAAVQLVEDGPDIVTFHESWPSSRDGRPNGIRVHHDDLYFPCVVFYNSGDERLTVDGEWVEPGEYVSIQEVAPNSPEARKALEDLIHSQTFEEYRTLRREADEKRRRM